MMVLRPAAEADEKGLCALGQLNWQGLAILPSTDIAWREKIASSLATFARSSARAPHRDDLYLLVLEDMETQRLVGTSQIVGRTAGSSTMGHYYHVDNVQLAPLKNVSTRTLGILQPVQRETVATEVGGLFLDPTVRQQGLSALASLSRFLLIASHPHRFCREIIAEIRGRIDEHRTSPFWNAVGRHFWDVDYADLMLHLARDPSLIPALISPIPIYLFLLGPALHASIGNAHPLSQVALNRLINQGFALTGDVDPFDAGPKVMAETNNLRIIREHRCATVRRVEFNGDAAATRSLVANGSLQFRACIAPITYLDEMSVVINPQTAEALQIAIGDQVRVITLAQHMMKSKKSIKI